MTFVPAPDVAQLAVINSTANNTWENVFHLLGTTEPDATALNDLATIYATWAAAHWIGHVAPNTQLVQIYGRDLTVQNGASVDFIPTTPIIGTRASPSLPLNATFALSLRTGLAGRSFRGRTYVGGLTEDILDTTGQALNTSNANGLVTDYNLLKAAFEASGVYKLAIVSTRHNNAYRTTAVVTPVLGYSYTDLFVDSQRRRLPAHNRHH